MDFDAIEIDIKHFYISGKRPKPLRSFTGTCNSSLHSAGNNSDCNGKVVSIEDKENVATCKEAHVSPTEDIIIGAPCENKEEKLRPVLCMIRSKRPKNRVAGVLRHGPRLCIHSNLQETDTVTPHPNNGTQPSLKLDDGCYSTLDKDDVGAIQDLRAQNSEDTGGVPSIRHLAPRSVLQQQGQSGPVQCNALTPSIIDTSKPFLKATVDMNQMYKGFRGPYRNAIMNTFATSRGNSEVEQQRGVSEMRRNITQLEDRLRAVSPDRQEKSTASAVEPSSGESSLIHRKTVLNSQQTVPVKDYMGPSPGNESDPFVKFFTIKLRGPLAVSHTARSQLTYTDLTNHLKGRPKTMSFNAYGSMVVQTLNIYQSRTLEQTTRLAGCEVSVTTHATLNTVTGAVWSNRLWNDGTEQDVIRQLDHEGVVEATAIKCTKAFDGSLICSARVKFTQRTRLPSSVITRRGFKLKAQSQMECPKQCLKCFKFDHETVACRLHVALCANCARPVSGHPQPCQRAKVCATCGGHHGALSVRCFAAHKAWRVCAVRAASNIDQAEAERLVDKEIVECQKRGGDYCKEYPVGGDL